MPDRRKAKSKYTLDRAIPGAFEGETITRRRLMVLGANGAGAVATAAFTLPVLAFSLAPVFKTQNMPWQPIGPMTMHGRRRLDPVPKAIVRLSPVYVAAHWSRT